MNELLLGCGILKKEVNYLVRKNNWPVDTLFLDSALHIDLEKLAKTLTKSLFLHKHRKPVVFYGACHPMMEKFLSDAKTYRTKGQNCIEMLIGRELFTQELANGAFFLLEEWVYRWENIMEQAFGNNWELIKDIFKEDRKYLLGLRTPCSDDFNEEAQKAASLVNLPLKWMDITLDHLEDVLSQLFNIKK